MPPSRGRGAARGGRNQGSGRGAPAAEPAPAPAEADVDFEQHPAGIILLSHAPPKGIRFSVSRDLFSNFATYATLPVRMIGEIDRWLSKKDGKLVIDWEADNSSTTQHLAVLLQDKYDFKLERWLDGRHPPRAKGLDAKRRYARAIASGPYASWAADEEAAGVNEPITIEYEEEGRRLEQTWTPVERQSIREDWRPGPRFKTKIHSSLPEHRYNTLVKMLFNVALPRNLSNTCVDWFNERLDGKDNSAASKKTTEGSPDGSASMHREQSSNSPRDTSEGRDEACCPRSSPTTGSVSNVGSCCSSLAVASTEALPWLSTESPT